MAGFAWITLARKVAWRKNRLVKLQPPVSERPRYIPKAAAIYHLNVYDSGKSRSRSDKKLRLRRLPYICHSAKYERSMSSARHTGTGKPKSRSRCFDLFCEDQGHICHMASNPKTVPRCMPLHGSVGSLHIVFVLGRLVGLVQALHHSNFGWTWPILWRLHTFKRKFSKDDIWETITATATLSCTARNGLTR